MYIILLGAPGSGKGTQANFIKNKYGFYLISSGNILRSAVNNKTILGNQVKKIINQGQLVDDHLMINMILGYLQTKDHKKYIFDGFPRTASQAVSLRNSGININCLIELNIPNDIIIQRITGRRIHIPSGRIYHTVLNPPKTHNIDDVTGELLTIRNDDREEIINKRIDEYLKLTEPLVNFYKNQSNNTNYYKIDGMQSIEAVNQQISRIIEIQLIK